MSDDFEFEFDEPRSRRFLIIAALVIAVVGIAVTGLLVAFKPETTTVQARDEADGERLHAELVIEVEDTSVAHAAATITVTNPGERPAWYAEVACSGPSEPSIGPAGARARGTADATATLRERLVAAGTTSRAVTLYPSSDEVACDDEGAAAMVEPGGSLTVEYQGSDTIDRSSALRAVAVITEVTRTGRPIGRIRLVVPVVADDDVGGTAVEPAVDAFLANPDVVAFIDATGDEGMLTHVSREPGGWRIGLSSGVGDLIGEVTDGSGISSVTVS